MSGWLLDTNVISEMRRPRPSRKVVDFIGSTPATRLFISIASIAEFRAGIEEVADPAGREMLTRWLDRTVRPMFEERVLGLTDDVLRTWLLLVKQGRKRRSTLQYPDALIAATAVHHGLTVVTRNERDFELFDVAILNPWTTG